jgi:hypothetical protein
LRINHLLVLTFSRQGGTTRVYLLLLNRDEAQLVAMLPHAFSHDSATYVVSFKPIGDQWRAALYKRDDGSVRELGPIAAEALAGLSEQAIRAGFIGLAEWLVKRQAVRPVLKRAHLDDAA